MTKTKMSTISKCRKYVAEFRAEFKLSSSNYLFCNICSIVVQSDRRSTVLRHRETEKHKRSLMQIQIPGQTFLPNEITSRNDFTDKVVLAFLSSDIPLYKINNPYLKDLFRYINKELPSESTCRSRIPLLVSTEVTRIKNLIQGENIFLVIDESELCGKKYFNTLIGLLKEPNKTYLIDCRVCDGSIDQRFVIHTIDDKVRDLEINRKEFSLLLTDAAPYMLAAGKILKEFYPNLFHVTCVAHLFHNCAEKVRAYYSNVDNLISSIKASTLKNKNRKNKFRLIGSPPEPVLTRWGTWIKAALYYSNNLPAVREIVESFEGNGLLVCKAKCAIQCTDLPQSLLEIKRDYACLLHLIEKTENTCYSIETAYQDLTTIYLRHDSCNIKKYILKRLTKNSDISAIMSLNRNDVSPSHYQLLQHCPSTSVTVERSFSMLKKLLSNDRHFLDQNVKNYLMFKYNSTNH